MQRVKAYLPNLSQLKAARDFEVEQAKGDEKLIKEAEATLARKTKSLESITNTIADHVVRCSTQRNKIQDIFTNI